MVWPACVEENTVASSRCEERYEFKKKQGEGGEYDGVLVPGGPQGTEEEREAEA